MRMCINASTVITTICQKLEIQLPYDPVIPLLDMDKMDSKTENHRDTTISMFIQKCSQWPR